MTQNKQIQFSNKKSDPSSVIDFLDDTTENIITDKSNSIDNKNQDDSLEAPGII